MVRRRTSRRGRRRRGRRHGAFTTLHGTHTLGIGGPAYFKHLEAQRRRASQPSLLEKLRAMKNKKLTPQERYERRIGRHYVPL